MACMEVTTEMLQRYGNGLCTAAERKAVEAWLNQDAEGDDFPLPGKEAETEQEIWLAINEYRQKPPVRALHRRRRMAGGMAACAATILVAAGVLLFLYYQRQPATDTANVATGGGQWQTISTVPGEKKQLMLPDGSQLMLNSASTVRYPPRFTGNTRTIYVSGEAFLSVARAASQPFIVNAAHAQVKVLGTAFNIEAYTGDSTVTVTVEEGRVAFGGERDTSLLLLAKGQQGVYTTHGVKEMHQVYAAGYSSWMHDKLVIRDKPLVQVAVLLQRWYNVAVVIDNPALQGEHFTGEFEGKEPEQVIKAIAFVLKCRYTIDNKTIHLY